MKRNAKLLICSAILFFLAITLATSSYAWLISLKRSGTIIFVSGEVKYELEGDLKEEDIIIPEKELVDKQYVLTNKSTIDSEVRVKLYYQFTSGEIEETWQEYSDSSTQEIKADFGNGWVYYEECWYYGELTDNNVNCTVIKGTENIKINVLESLTVSGDNYGNADSKDKNLIIKIVFQAKQKDYVEWKEIGFAIDKS